MGLPEFEIKAGEAYLTVNKTSSRQYRLQRSFKNFGFSRSKLILQLNFQATRIQSLSEFEAIRADWQSIFDARYQYEHSIGSQAEIVVLEGTCGACLRPTSFRSSTENGSILADKRRIPNWREGLHCSCELGLSSRYRAILHFLSSRVGLYDWTRVINFGNPESLVEPLTVRSVNCSRIPRLTRNFSGENGAAFSLDAPDMSAHIVVSLDYLQRVPPLDLALFEIHRVLVSGGQFVFTVPFRVNSVATSTFISHLPRVNGLLPTEFGAEVHEIGWDILDSLRKAGFADAAAHLYWSEELGYLGPFNFIFSACR